MFRIQEGKNDPQKKEKKEKSSKISCSEVLKASTVAWKSFMEA
jgi:hypothetical protein